MVVETKELTEANRKAICDEFVSDTTTELFNEYCDLILDMLVDENGQEN